MSGLEPPEHQLAVPEHGRQQVVEIVGHAARQAPDRLHALRLPQLFAQSAALGDVGGDADHSHHVPVRSAQRRVAGLEREPLHLGGGGELLPGQGAAQMGEDLGMLAVEIERRLAHDLSGFVPEPRQAASLGDREAAFGIEREQHDRARRHDPPQARLGLAQRLLDAPRLGHVAELEHEHLAAVEIGVRSGHDREPNDPVLRDDPALLGVERAAGERGGVERLEEPPLSLGMQILERHRLQPIRRMPGHAAGHRIGEQDAARLRIHHDDRPRAALEQEPIARLGGPQDLEVAQVLEHHHHFFGLAGRIADRQRAEIEAAVRAVARVTVFAVHDDVALEDERHRTRAARILVGPVGEVATRVATGQADPRRPRLGAALAHDRVGPTDRAHPIRDEHWSVRGVHDGRELLALAVEHAQLLVEGLEPPLVAGMQAVIGGDLRLRPRARGDRARNAPHGVRDPRRRGAGNQERQAERAAVERQRETLDSGRSLGRRAGFRALRQPHRFEREHAQRRGIGPPDRVRGRPGLDGDPAFVEQERGDRVGLRHLGEGARSGLERRHCRVDVLQVIEETQETVARIHSRRLARHTVPTGVRSGSSARRSAAPANPRRAARLPRSCRRRRRSGGCRCRSGRRSSRPCG